jgi:hypothetical protein
MAKKKGYDVLSIDVRNPFDPPVADPSVTGWHESVQRCHPNRDANEFCYLVQDYSGAGNPNMLDITIRRKLQPALVSATLRKIADLIDAHGQELLFRDFVAGDLTINDDGSLGLVTPEDEDAYADKAAA